MTIKILIIEDEQPAVDKLIRLLSKVKAQINVIGVTDSIIKSISFLKVQTPDLILSDIHLVDGLSFKIFDSIEVDIPIIFTTAYDNYAIEAFKMYSIDYLLKPVTKRALDQALDKYQRVHKGKQMDFSELIKAMNPQVEKYKNRFLVHSRDQYHTLKDDDIAYFYADGKYTFLVSKNGKRFFSDHNISQLENFLDPSKFFKVNRKYIIHISSISTMTAYSKSRLKVDLKPPHPEDVIVSVERSPAFKAWLGK